MARTTGEVWSSGSAQAPASDSSREETAPVETKEPSAGETQREAKPQAKRETVQAKPKTEPKKPDPVVADDDHDDEPIPDDLAGIKTALAASRGDKRKFRKQWQETERALAEHQGEVRALRAQLEAIQRVQQPQQPVAEQPKPEDLDTQYFGDPRGYTEQRLQTAEQKLIGEIRKRDFKWSVHTAKRQYEDFDEAYAAADKIIPANKALAEQLMASDDPGEFIYQVGKNALAAGGDPFSTDLISLKAKWREEWEAERSTQPTGGTPQATPPVIRPAGSPPSIARARGTGAASAPQWSGPRTTSQVWSARR